MRLLRSAGFSLPELMTVLAIAAVMLALAAPDMGQMIRSHRLKAAVNDLFGAIGLARSEAITRGVTVELAAAGGADFSRGWAVFIDRDGDRRPGAGDELIMAHGPLPDGIAVGSTFAGQQDGMYIAYNGGGRSCSDTSSLAARWGTLSLFMGGQTRHIKINMLGRARICDPARDGASCSGADPP
jgi:type IV fimbrial biogenesis protein FimT